MATIAQAEDSVVFLNGQYVLQRDAVVSVLDHGLLYGDGVFESIGAIDGRVFRLDAHLDRLERSARLIQLDCPISRSELRTAVMETLRRNHLSEAYIRLVITRGPGYPIMDPRVAAVPTVVVMTHSSTPPPGLEHFTRTGGLRLHTAKTRKIPSICLEPRVKSLNYLSQILARLEAIDAGADEALMLSTDHFVAEGPGENIFLVMDDGRLITAPVQHVLAGITRAAVIEVSQAMNLKVEETRFTLYDVYEADEVFLTSTFGGVIPVEEVDRHKIGDWGPGRLTVRIKEAYDRLRRESGEPIYDFAAVPAEQAVVRGESGGGAFGAARTPEEDRR